MTSRTRHFALAASTAGIFVHAIASGADIRHIEATHKDTRYTVNFDVVLDAEQSKVWRIMTDFAHLTQASDVIIESRLMKSEREGQDRVYVALHACVLIFCKTMEKVVDIQAIPQSDIVVTTDPALSDFSYSVERWQVSTEGARKTRLRYSAEMTPDFFIPPLVGPWIVKSFLKKEIQATAIKVEALAGRE